MSRFSKRGQNGIPMGKKDSITTNVRVDKNVLDKSHRLFFTGALDGEEMYCGR
jgi:hypothetical protein